MTEEIMTEKQSGDRYCLITEKNKDGSLLCITVLPRAKIARKSKINLFVVAAISITTLITVKYYMKFSHHIALISIACAFVVSSLIFRRPTIESFSVLRDYGVQITKVKGLVFLPARWNQCYFAETEFIPSDQIVDIIINEGFVRGFQVVFYMAVLVKKSEKLKLLFQSTRPTLEDQRLIYNLTRSCLFVGKKPFTT